MSVSLFSVSQSEETVASRAIWEFADRTNGPQQGDAEVSSVSLDLSSQLSTIAWAFVPGKKSVVCQDLLGQPPRTSKTKAVDTCPSWYPSRQFGPLLQAS